MDTLNRILDLLKAKGKSQIQICISYIPKRICNMLGLGISLRSLTRTVSADILRLLWSVTPMLCSFTSHRLSVTVTLAFADNACNTALGYSELTSKTYSAYALGVTCFDLFSLFVRENSTVIHRNHSLSV